jgi:hypothetical protein
MMGSVTELCSRKKRGFRSQVSEKKPIDPSFKT